MDRPTPLLRRLVREPFPGISHLVGMALSIVGLIVLLDAAHGRARYIAGFSIYGATLILLYMASGLCHSLPVKANGEVRLDRFDRAAIFGLIAGTYTPVCLLSIRGAWGWSLMGSEWGLAALGILGVLLDWPRRRWVRTIPYVLMGWLALVAISPIHASLPPAAIAWLFGGGLIYSVGVVVFLTNRPDLWAGKFVAHDLWHVMVLAGSACHFMLMLFYVA